MKIVSKTKDYYDHVANILGVDEKLRYERRPFHSAKTYDGTIWYPEFAEFTIPCHVEDDYQSAYPTTPDQICVRFVFFRIFIHGTRDHATR